MSDYCAFLNHPTSDSDTDVSSGDSGDNSPSERAITPVESSVRTDKSLETKKNKWKKRTKDLVSVLQRNGYDVDYM